MFGILLLSISKMCEEKFLQSAFLFTMLLHMKHIFIYVSPVYIVYLLKFYCLRKGSPLISLVKLGAIVIGVTLFSFGPFYDHLPQVRTRIIFSFYISEKIIRSQVLARLFPFKRGLCHAYWAPNFWTLYNILDKIVSKLLRTEVGRGGTNTGGLVQEFDHLVLPSIKPITTFVLTFLAVLPCICKLLIAKYDRYDAHNFFLIL